MLYKVLYKVNTLKNKKRPFYQPPPPPPPPPPPDEPPPPVPPDELEPEPPEYEAAVEKLLIALLNTTALKTAFPEYQSGFVWFVS